MVGTGGPPPALAQAISRSTDFGRWETKASPCTWQRAPSSLRQSCQGLRLEQNLQGLLSVRFVAAGQLEPIALEHLVFAGAVETTAAALRCGGDGRCRPQWPARLAVATVGDARFDQRGLVRGLPRTHLASGHCQLEPTLVRCEARGRNGERWSAEADLSQPTLRTSGAGH